MYIYAYIYIYIILVLFLWRTLANIGHIINILGFMIPTSLCCIFFFLFTFKPIVCRPLSYCIVSNGKSSSLLYSKGKFPRDCKLWSTLILSNYISLWLLLLCIPTSSAFCVKISRVCISAFMLYVLHTQTQLPHAILFCLSPGPDKGKGSMEQMLSSLKATFSQGDGNILI